MLASVDGQLLPMPINLDTINRLYGLDARRRRRVERFLGGARRAGRARAHERGRRRRARWAASSTRSSSAATRASSGASTRPSSTPASPARIPTRTNRDDRYFTDSYQAHARATATRRCSSACSTTRNIKVALETRLRRGRATRSSSATSSTPGPIDEFFDEPLRHAAVPLAALRVRRPWTLRARAASSRSTQVNYPERARVHAHHRVQAPHRAGAPDASTIVYEFPARRGRSVLPDPARRERARSTSATRRCAAARSRRHLRRPARPLPVLQHGPGRRPGALRRATS